MLTLVDNVVEDIKRDIGGHAAERGGALLGPAGTNLCSLFVFDPHAETTSASYRPSTELISEVKRLERETGLVFKGIVHSHPDGMDRPSHQDLVAFANNLAANPRMAHFVAPIIARSSGGELEAHEMDLGDGMKMSCFVGYRLKPGRRGVQVEIEPARILVMALDAATRKLKQALEDGLAESLEMSEGWLELNGLMHAVRTLDGGSMQLGLMFPHNFPCVPPLAVYSAKNGEVLEDAETMGIVWDLSCLDEGALARRLGSKVIRKVKRGQGAKKQKEMQNVGE